MCGICGIINFNKTLVEEKTIKEMMRAMKHRGPNDDGVFIEENIGIGFVRLSIIDLTMAGHQPMFDKTGRYVIVFNGEVFNYIELGKELLEKGYSFLSKTDTEIVLYSFIEWGEKCQEKFIGMWAFAIFDKLNKSVFISRDRFGIKPLYYYIDNEKFVFASDIPPILKVFNQPIQPNDSIIFDFLVYNRVNHTNKTFFKGIQKLQHGHQIVLNLKDPKITRWYNILNCQMDGFNPNEFIELLKNSIMMQLRSDVPVGISLSGGLDSSTIASLAEDMDNSLKSFSAIYNLGDKGDETEFIKALNINQKKSFTIKPDAESFLDDLDQFIEAMVEPVTGTSVYAEFKVMQLAKGKVIVLLNGQGIDEALGGYHLFFGIYFKSLLFQLKFWRFLVELICYLKKHKSITAVKYFIYYLLPTKIRNKRYVLNKEHINRIFYKNNLKTDSNINKINDARSILEFSIEHFEQKFEHHLIWSDKSSMWFSLESRFPYLDHRFIEKCLGMKEDQIIKNGTTKAYFRNSVISIIPEKIRLRQDKVGFETPADEWFRSETLKDFITEIFNSNEFINRPYFNASKVKKLYANHLLRRVNKAEEIWRCIHLELWLRRFIDPFVDSTS
jgi:asparagine synthase (glutamine-hydrolysing)